MKLLFDANLAPRLARDLEDLFPGSVHVEQAGLRAADDEPIWEHAARNEFIVVSKDSDFHHRSCLRGHPPKVIWVSIGNCSTKTVEMILRQKFREIEAFCEDREAAFLVL
ncbi:MAG: DUF5615 family PIN-like protein [Acidobacteria bacterium]|nr:DUF5615 family PIN-like protein [Acidobacteriota bacterium]